MRISDWSSDVCSSDLHRPGCGLGFHGAKYRRMQIMPASMHFALDCMHGWTGRLEGATFCGTRGDAVAAGVDRAPSTREEHSNVYKTESALFYHGPGGGVGRGRAVRSGRRGE